MIVKKNYSLRSEIPSMMKSNPIIVTNQKSPPFRKSHAGVKKLKLFPKNIHSFPVKYPAEANAIKIAPITKINPTKSSLHLFIVIF